MQPSIFRNVHMYIKIWWNSKRLKILYLIYSIHNSIIIFLGSMVNVLVKKFGKSSMLGTWSLFFVIVFGLFSSIMYFRLIKDHKLWQRVFLAASAMLITVCFIAISFSEVFFIILIAIFGLVSFPLIPLILEMITNDNKIIPITVNNTFLFLCGQIVGLILQFVFLSFDYFWPEISVWLILYLIVGLQLLEFWLIRFF